MVFFCPTCGNLLLVESGSEKNLRWYCQTCPYICSIKQKIEYAIPLKNKEVDDLMGGEEEWATAETIDVKCPKQSCDGKKAYFQMFQIRSADEPMTQFYKCITCGHQWKEG